MRSVRSHSPEETIGIARGFAAQLVPGDIVAFFGEVGSGKTLFIRGICLELGVEKISSPTFVIMNEYEGVCRNSAVVLRHFDFYRIEGEAQLTELGVDEFLSDPLSLVFLEWTEHAQLHLPREYWSVHLRKVNDETRDIRIEKHAEA